MDRDELVDELPDGLATALKLHESGEPDAVIAAALAVPEESVPVLLQVARAKLEHLLAGSDDESGDCEHPSESGQSDPPQKPVANH